MPASICPLLSPFRLYALCPLWFTLPSDWNAFTYFFHLCWLPLFPSPLVCEAGIVPPAASGIGVLGGHRAKELLHPILIYSRQNGDRIFVRWSFAHIQLEQTRNFGPNIILLLITRSKSSIHLSRKYDRLKPLVDFRMVSSNHHPVSSSQ